MAVVKERALLRVGLTDRGGTDNRTAQLRRQYFETLERLEPELLPQLQDLVQEPFDELADHLLEHGPITDPYWAISDLLEPPSAPVRPSGVSGDWATAIADALVDDRLAPQREAHRLGGALAKQIARWCQPLHLHNDPWPRDVIVGLFQYHRDPLGGADEAWTLGQHVPWIVHPVPQPAPASPSPRRYEPWRELPAEYEEYIKSHMAQSLSRYLEKGEVTKERDYRSLWAHMEWLVRHQSLGEKYTHSTGGAAVETSTIHRAVKRLARELGLTLRPAPGRRQ